MQDIINKEFNTFLSVTGEQTISRVQMSVDYTYPTGRMIQQGIVKVPEFKNVLKGAIIEGVAGKNSSNVFGIFWNSPENLNVFIPSSKFRSVQIDNPNLSEEQRQEEIAKIEYTTQQNATKTGTTKTKGDKTIIESSGYGESTNEFPDDYGKSNTKKYIIIGIVGVLAIISGVVVYNKFIKK